MASLSELPLVRNLVHWWRRPPARDRILRALFELEKEDPAAVPGLTLVARAKVGRGAIYSRLMRLEEDGLVGHTVLVPAVDGQLQRLGYLLTDKGRKAAQGGM